MNQTIRSKEQLVEFVSGNKGVMVYFYSNFCAPCQSLRPKVDLLVQTRFPLMKLVFIDAMLYPELAADYAVFTSPSLLVFFEGKEAIRESKYVSVEDIENKMERYYKLVFGN
jgi:thiol-disulfide isomerase/thioredoxin